MPLVDFDPVAKLVADLRKEFGHFGLFLHDVNGGNVIAVKWKPAAFVAQTLKVAGAYAVEPVPSSKDAVVPNILSILASIQTLGAGIIERIQL